MPFEIWGILPISQIVRMLWYIENITTEHFLPEKTEVRPIEKIVAYFWQSSQYRYQQYCKNIAVWCSNAGLPVLSLYYSLIKGLDATVICLRYKRSSNQPKNCQIHYISPVGLLLCDHAKTSKNCQLLSGVVSTLMNFRNLGVSFF